MQPDIWQKENQTSLRWRKAVNALNLNLLLQLKYGTHHSAGITQTESGALKKSKEILTKSGNLVSY